MVERGIFVFPASGQQILLVWKPNVNVVIVGILLLNRLTDFGQVNVCSDRVADVNRHKKLISTGTISERRRVIVVEIEDIVRSPVDDNRRKQVGI